MCFALELTDSHTTAVGSGIVCTILSPSVCCSLNSVDMAVGGGIESQVLTDLRPFTIYNVSVLASTGEGPGPTNNTQFLTEQTGELRVLVLSNLCHHVSCKYGLVIAIVGMSYEATLQ